MTAAEYADRILRFASTVPCLSALLGEDRDDACECYGCAGRIYVRIADATPVAAAAGAPQPTGGTE